MGIVCVGCEVDERQVDDELRNLHDRNVLFPPHAFSASDLVVIVVHDNVDCEVEGYGYPGDGCLACKLGIAKEYSSSMVVSVQKCYAQSATVSHCDCRRCTYLKVSS